MTGKRNYALIVDGGMTITLLLLMSYSLIGETTHEGLGVSMFLLLIVHHILNVRWTHSLFGGKYTAIRAIQTSLVVLCLISILGSGASGIVLSKHLFTAIPLGISRSLARTTHMLCAYWGFLLMSLHLGFHSRILFDRIWGSFLKNSATRRWTARVLLGLAAVYGGYVFIQRDLLKYMTMKIRFAFFDFNESIPVFLLDYTCVLILYILMGHYIFKGIRTFGKTRENQQ